MDWRHLPDLNKEDYKPLYIQLSELLAEYIRSEGLSEGASMPSENDLLSRYDVSRTTIRQAIQRLESQDILQKIRGKGTFVAAPKHRESVRGFQNLEETLREHGIEVTNHLLTFDEIHPPKRLAESLQLPEGEKATRIRRLKLADGTPFAIEERILLNEIANQFPKEAFCDKPIFDLLESKPENEIVRVTYAITSWPLTEQEASELKVCAQDAVIRRTGLYFDRSNRPIMFGRVTFIADRTELKFEFHKADDNWGIVSVV